MFNLNSILNKLIGRYPWSAVVEGTVGYKTVIWRWAHVSKKAEIGSNCMIGAGVYIGPGVRIGDNCRIQNNVFIPEGTTIGDNVFIGPHTVFCNDRYPPNRIEQTYVGNCVVIGANCTILPCTINHGTQIGAGSVVTHEYLETGLYYGNPASLKGKI